MRYQNPVVTGFYPDPSVCEANGKYYLVCSSFQYFPGVPLFESDDLINRTQIGHVLTRPTQVQLAHVPSSGGVFAPTIRYNNGRFYMVTTNDTTHENFYVWTDDIHGEWSDPITIDQGGIDPSLLFDNGHVYFISNGADDMGVGGVTQCEIDIETGRKLTPSRCIWQGTGGRCIESPHMYRIGGWYYLMAAEGGTEYGHMIVLARGQTPWGPFKACPYNPILTNRDKAPGIIQGIGHGDLIQAPGGAWFILSLGFRQIHMWMRFHHLGREVFLTPVHFERNGWLYCGNDGTTEEFYDIASDKPQTRKTEYTFGNTDWRIEWCALRYPDWSNYVFAEDHLILRAGKDTLDDMGSPTFLALRQKAFDMDYSVRVTNSAGEGGVTVYGGRALRPVPPPDGNGLRGGAEAERGRHPARAGRAAPARRQRGADRPLGQHQLPLLRPGRRRGDLPGLRTVEIPVQRDFYRLHWRGAGSVCTARRGNAL